MPSDHQHQFQALHGQDHRPLAQPVGQRPPGQVEEDQRDQEDDLGQGGLLLRPLAAPSRSADHQQRDDLLPGVVVEGVEGLGNQKPRQRMILLVLHRVDRIACCHGCSSRTRKSAVRCFRDPEVLPVGHHRFLILSQGLSERYIVKPRKSSPGESVAASCFPARSTSLAMLGLVLLVP